MIKLQKQIIPNGCVSACLAMLTGETVDFVTKEFHPHYIERKVEIPDYLETRGVLAMRVENRENIEKDKVYLLSVPSLNSPGRMHEIVLDTRNENAVVYDPARKGSQQYTLDDSAGPGYTKLTSWVIDFEIVFAPKIGLTGDNNGSRS